MSMSSLTQNSYLFTTAIISASHTFSLSISYVHIIGTASSLVRPALGEMPALADGISGRWSGRPCSQWNVNASYYPKCYLISLTDHRPVDWKERELQVDCMMQETVTFYQKLVNHMLISRSRKYFSIIANVHLSKPIILWSSYYHNYCIKAAVFASTYKDMQNRQYSLIWLRKVTIIIHPCITGNFPADMYTCMQ